MLFRYHFFSICIHINMLFELVMHPCELYVRSEGLLILLKLWFNRLGPILLFGLLLSFLFVHLKLSLFLCTGLTSDFPRLL